MIYLAAVQFVQFKEIEMKTWKELNGLTQGWMSMLGGFSPTVNPQDKQVKGVMFDSEGEIIKAYLDPDELREIADACLEVAQFLEDRAKENQK